MHDEFDNDRIERDESIMVELVKPHERIRDLTEAPHRIPIEIEDSTAFEVILVIWMTFDQSRMNVSHALGQEFHDRVIELTSEDLKTEISTLGGAYCAVWLGIAGLIETAPRPHDTKQMFDWLGSISGQRLRRWLLGYMARHASGSLIEQAVSGDMDALRTAICEQKDCEQETEYVDKLISIFEIPGEELARRAATALHRFHDEVFAKLDIDFEGAIRRAAGAQRPLTAKGDPKAIIEDATKGIDYDIPLGVKRVVMVPTVVTRPLSVIDQHRDTLTVYYGMPDEFVESDPEAPPAWLVNTYKALSDERRLRILRRLSEDDASLEDLTEMLELSKSTVHHHISVLRGAGLVRVTVPTDEGHKHKGKTYSLRDKALGDAAGVLDSYLEPREREKEHD